MVVAIVFGLSMDYEVFLVSRVHEEWQHRRDNTAAVRAGLVRTGRVITGAAAVVVVVFASFAASDTRVLKLFGISMTTAVCLDALVIRTILLPAVLQLLGRRTWPSPNWFTNGCRGSRSSPSRAGAGSSPRSRRPPDQQIRGSGSPTSLRSAQ